MKDEDNCKGEPRLWMRSSFHLHPSLLENNLRSDAAIGEEF
jgi:hypothetical protein